MHDERKCGKCGGERARVTAQSVVPPGVFIQCQDCGHSTLAPASAAPALTPLASSTDIDTRRIERLVGAAIDARGLPCRLQAVDKTALGWRVSIRTRVGGFQKFDVSADSMSAMRTAIDRALATEIR